jgi:hypothetical protein
MQWRALDEIDAGVCDSMTQDEIGERYPLIAIYGRITLDSTPCDR